LNFDTNGVARGEPQFMALSTRAMPTLNRSRNGLHGPTAVSPGLRTALAGECHLETGHETHPSTTSHALHRRMSVTSSRHIAGERQLAASGAYVFTHETHELHARILGRGG
jgi:hypothetical protein